MARLFTLLMLLWGTIAQASSLIPRQASSKYCDPTSKMCYLQVPTRASYPVFRIAIPDASSAPFDAILQMIVPVSLNWAGFAWGGGMIGDPLTVAWPNGNKATVSSRWATSRALPSVYNNARYTTLGSSKNSTHWTVEVVCSGCSSWSGGSLSPGGVNSFAWAVSTTPVSQPSSSSSSFSVHNNVGMFSADLSQAKVAKSTFDQYVSTMSKSQS